MVEQVQDNNIITIILRPNRSVSWHQNKLFLLAMMIPMLAISTAWSIVGAWPVLPVFGLEFIALSYLIYLVSYRSYQEDSITLDTTQLTICNGIGKKRSKQVKKILNRSKTLLYVKKPERPMDLPVLYLDDSKTRVEIGHYLNEEDREHLRTILVNLGLQQYPSFN